MRALVDFVALQAVWFACVLGAARGAPLLGPLVALGWCAWHVLRSRSRARELRLLAAVTLLGTLCDSLLALSGRVHYRDELAGLLAPPWISALWAAFATSFETSFAWAGRDLRLAALLGLVCAPFSYWAGERLGALEFGEPRALSLAALGLAWAVALPLALALARRMR